MEPTIPPPHPDPHPPTAFVPPPGACDAHCHVFGPADRFPFAANRTYTPPDASTADLAALHQRLGLSRAVLVQASCHGIDNSAMVDALRRSPGRLAGVAMINESFTRDDLTRLHEVGVRGVRFNFVSHLGGAPEPGLFQQLVSRVTQFGWHVVLHVDATDLPAHTEMLKHLPCPFVIDHMARVPTEAGLGQAPFQALLSVMANERAWVKISGAERLSTDGPPRFGDVVPYARALIDVAPERVLWGTDWPHPNVPRIPDDGDLLDLLADFAPDESVRHQILVDNPKRLYDFK